VIDVNVHLSRWPFRRVPLDETPALVAKLREIGITQAWAASFDAILHKDVAAVNARLVETCRRDGGGLLIPFGAVNPSLPDWEEDLRRCREQHQMPGIRLYPNYHGYTLDSPAFARLLELATAAKLLVQICVSMEDERSHHPLVRVPPVDVKPLPGVLANVPAARVMILNGLRGARSALLSLLTRIDQVTFDIATLEGTGGVADVLTQIPAERLLLGTHAPFFYPQSAVLKLKESPLSADVVRQLTSQNAERLLSRS
jgi:predicted TIM-barrel fold metal-dependent hydrolase